MYNPEVHHSLLHLPGEASIPRRLPGRKPSDHGHIGMTDSSVTVTVNQTAPHRCRSRRMILIQACPDDSPSDEPVNSRSAPNGIISQQRNHAGFPRHIDAHFTRFRARDPGPASRRRLREDRQPRTDPRRRVVERQVRAGRNDASSIRGGGRPRLARGRPRVIVAIRRCIRRAITWRPLM